MSSPRPSSEVHYVAEEVVRCDGSSIVGNASFGHPAVYLHLDQHKVACPYCGRNFIIREIKHDW